MINQSEFIYFIWAKPWGLYLLCFFKWPIPDSFSCIFGLFKLQFTTIKYKMSHLVAAGIWTGAHLNMSLLIYPSDWPQLWLFSFSSKTIQNKITNTSNKLVAGIRTLDPSIEWVFYHNHYPRTPALKQLTVNNVQYKFYRWMISAIGSDHSTNLDTTTAQFCVLFNL